MNNLHFQRWTDQLRDSGHEVFWFDILDQGYASSLSWMTQVTGWKKEFLKRRGRTFLKTKLPKVYNWLERKYDVPVEVAFERALLDIQPDVVHSFALYVSAAPIKNVMQAHDHIKWAYSTWGSDLFYFQHQPNYLADIKQVLLRVDYLFTDCHRDHQIAVRYGFQGTFLGVFPGGGGYELDDLKQYQLPLEQRKVIAVKGYQNRSGRAIPVLKALEMIKDQLADYQIVVFGADHEDVFRFREVTERSRSESEIPNITIHGKLAHKEVLKLFGKALLYIGNSNSDGMPNTLLEAICCGCYPIQSNPGGATAEIITDGSNGRLITDCDDPEHISLIIKEVLQSQDQIKQAVNHNLLHVIPSLDRNTIKQQVVSAYNSI
ncbi:glycosyltransferase family 4 protein [Nonlabens sp. YIK11]|uniref:glycosyltransferase family 4 protein n=1 Tax=Nonlabens sp. YIK11 TaxID=1453349 RepID=UPI001E63658E|nr:glycosyltransferase [Nonlabens sp. YIK11]